MAGPRKYAEDVERTSSAQGGDSRPPGYFVSSDLQADTARFLDDVKTRIRLRGQAEQPSLTKASLRLRA